MPDDAFADAVEIIPDERSPLLLLGLIGMEFAALLGLLILMS